MGAVWASPPDPPALSPGEAHVWRASLVAPAATAQGLREVLSPDEAERAARFVFARDRERFVLARGWLRRLLGAYLALAPAGLRFTYSEHGKPSLAQQPPGARLCFNLAHSGDLALYAFALGQRVGVDVERVRDELDYTMLLSGVFSPREQGALAALPEGQRRLAFFHGWARKEAFLKARGDGLAYAPDRVEVGLLPDGPGPLRLPHEQGLDGPWAIYGLDPGPGYVGAVVAEGPPVRLRHYRLGAVG